MSIKTQRLFLHERESIIVRRGQWEDSGSSYASAWLYNLSIEISVWDRNIVCNNSVHVLRI